jgi:hypothetical protein
MWKWSSSSRFFHQYVIAAPAFSIELTVFHNLTTQRLVPRLHHLLQKNAMIQKVGAVLRRQVHDEPQKMHGQHPPDAYHLPDDEPKPQVWPVCAG